MSLIAIFAAVASPRTPAGKQATLLASRRERPLRIDNCFDHAPQNLSLLRRIALNALNLEQSFKGSTRQKSNQAATSNNYMLTILAACLSHHDDASKASCQ